MTITTQIRQLQCMKKDPQGFVRHVMDALFSFHFLADLIKNLLVKLDFESYYLKLSLPMSFKCFLIFASF